MRFKQFIIESETTAEEVAEMVLADCQPYLKEIAFDGTFKTVLKRGMKITGDWSKEKVHAKRKPTHTNYLLHDVLDKVMKSQGGSFFRSQAIFCAGNTETARSYNEPCLIFPIGNFTYAWSPTIADAYMFFDNTHHQVVPDGIDEILGELEIDDESFQFISPYSAEWLKIVSEYLTKAKPYIYNKHLPECIKKWPDNEVMISCDEYYAIKINESAKSINWFDSIFMEHLAEIFK